LDRNDQNEKEENNGLKWIYVACWTK